MNLGTASSVIECQCLIDLVFELSLCQEMYALFLILYQMVLVDLSMLSIEPFIFQTR